MNDSMDWRAGAARRWKEEVSGVVERILERARRMGINVSDAEPAISVPLDGSPACATCNNQRYIITEAGITPCPDCGVVAQRAAKSLDAYSSATGRAREQTFENFKTTLDGQMDRGLQLCHDAALAFAESRDGWLVFHGSYGNGKSHLCAAVANRLREHGKACIFVSMPDLTKSLKDLMDDDFARSVNQTYGQRLSKYQTAPVLILDDIHAEKVSDWSEGVLFEIVDYRYRNRLPTVFATNLDPLDKGEFDPRIISRWSDVELSIIIANNAPDYRQRSMEER
jgi:DNA replication protein DnaC